MISLPEISATMADMIAQRGAQLLPGTSFLSTSVSVLFTYKNAVVTEPDFQ